MWTARSSTWGREQGDGVFYSSGTSNRQTGDSFRPMGEEALESQRGLAPLVYVGAP